MSRKITLEQGEEKAVSEVIEALKAGLVVAIPTETFYGLAVDPFNEKALKRLFALKRRPPQKPVLLLIGDLAQLSRLVEEITPLAQKLIRRFWPGPLTLVFEAQEGLPRPLTGETGKVAVRLSSHPVVRKIACSFGPITGTSANLSGKPPARSPAEVEKDLDPDLILEAGLTPGKAPSTIVDVTVSPPRILREGMIPAEEILEVALGKEDP